MEYLKRIEEEYEKRTGTLYLGGCGLREWPEAPHVWPMFDGYLPEAREALEDVAHFIAGLDV